MPYDDQKEYLKHNSCDCEDSSSCDCNTDCGCCPVGTVAIYDDKSNHIGCLSPNDAAIYQVDTIDVPEGFIKVIVDGVYIGLLTVADYKEYICNFA